MMTMANCGDVTARTLGMPDGCAVRADKGTLPRAMFVAKTPVSAGTKQRLARDVASVAMLAVLRAANTGLDEDARMPEILVLGLRLAPGVRLVPDDVVELIAMQRRGGIVFAVVRDVEVDGAPAEECAFAVRRAEAGRPGHVPVFHVFHGPWTPAADARLELMGSTMGELWDSFNSQIILGDASFADLDARIARAQRVRDLEAAVAKLTADHARTKNPAQRNAIYAKLHKARHELDALTGRARG